MSDHTQEILKDAIIQPIILEDFIALLLQYGPQTDRARDLGKAFGNSQSFVIFALFWGTKKQII